MKKLIHIPLALALAFTLFLTSCGSDDGPGPPPHEVGEWELDSYVLSNLPTGFESNEGRVFSIEELSFGGLSFESYELSLAQDNTFSRRIEVSGPNINDDGTWELDGDDMVLMIEDQDEEVYQIENNESDQLWWSNEIQFALIEDAVLDTLTAEYANSLSDDDFFALFSNVTLDLIYTFERQ